MVSRLIALVVLVAVMLGLLAYSQMVEEPLHVSGFIEAEDVRLGSRVGGRVARVLVEEGQRVTPGTVLVELEPFDLNERLAQAIAEREARRAEYKLALAGFRAEEIAAASAKVDQLAAELTKLEEGPRAQEISAAEARVRLAQAELELAQLQHARIRSLYETNAASRDEFDAAVTRLRVAEETVLVRKEELDLLQEGTRDDDIAAARALYEQSRQELELRQAGSRAEEIARAKAALAGAEAAVNAIERRREELTIRAPIEGVVESIDLEPGDLVSPNSPVVSLIDPSLLWVRAYVPEDRLAVKIDQRVQVTVDSRPNERFEGHVSFIARQAEFTPGNVQTPEERSKQVFRIKVVLDEGHDVLLAGMPADVWLEPPE